MASPLCECDAQVALKKPFTVSQCIRDDQDPTCKDKCKDYCEDLRSHLVQDSLDDHHAYTNVVVSDYHPLQEKVYPTIEGGPGGDIA